MGERVGRYLFCEKVRRDVRIRGRSQRKIAKFQQEKPFESVSPWLLAMVPAIIVRIFLKKSTETLKKDESLVIRRYLREINS